MRIKVAEATNLQLDWLVAKCEGESYSPVATTNGIGMEFPATNYTTDWAALCPIIERESISVIRCEDDYAVDEEGFCTDERIPVWAATTGQHGAYAIYGSQGDDWGDSYSFSADSVTYGPTPLIAAMRCYATSKLGREVEVPEELV